MKKLIISITALIVIADVFAQNDMDALRYSQTEFGGSSRSVATGGAFGALGGDFGSLSINPAGIAVYRESEFTFTPAFYTAFSNSEYLGSNNFESKYNFNFSNIGGVISYIYKEANDGKIAPRTNGWVSSNFGIGMNRIKNFNNRVYFEGLNSTNSIVDTYVEQANAGGGVSLNNLEQSYPFGADLAYATYLMDPTDSLGGTYFRAFSLGSGLMQRKEIVRSGSHNDFAITFGGNYSNKIYVGAGFNFPVIRFYEFTTFEEEATSSDTATNFNSLRINDDLSSEGQGFNFRFGIIARIGDFMRIGGSVQTPTFYEMTDRFSTRFSSDILSDNHEKSSPDGKFSYYITTPMKATTSMAFVIGKRGLISADYEVIDYSTARLRSLSYNFFDENESIYEKYHQTGNLRVGTEWKFENISLRGGYGIYGTPFHSAYKPATGGNQSKTFYTFGIGLREKEYFCDLAYVYSQASDYHTSYSLKNTSIPGSVNTTTAHNFQMTVGVRF